MWMSEPWTDVTTPSWPVDGQSPPALVVLQPLTSEAKAATTSSTMGFILGYRREPIKKGRKRWGRRDCRGKAWRPAHCLPTAWISAASLLRLEDDADVQALGPHPPELALGRMVRS